MALIMHNLFGWFLTLFAAFWLLMAARGMAREFRGEDRSKWVTGLMFCLVMVGAGGFFAAALSATGILKLPLSYEWPAGYVRGVVTAEDGKYIVPLVPSGRVQLYDPQWHFIRGWQVDAEGGDFQLQSTPNNLIEVFTARGEHHFTFSEDGRLMSSEHLTGSFQARPNNAQWIVVPTVPWLWIFSSPFLSWGVALVGFAGLAILRKIRRKPALNLSGE